MSDIESNNKKVFVGLSGGVDSAVSAALLQKEGYDVTGVFIRIAIPGYPCTAGEDKIEAQRVAAHLRIPFIEIDLSEEYQKEVFDATVEEFGRGHTPNPDTLCNQKIKFGAFYEFAKSCGADFIATGHYAQVKQKQIETNIAQRDGASVAIHQQMDMLVRRDLVSAELLSGADKEKDQSYFLWMVPETVLRQTLFPVGDLQKSEVRTLAKKLGLPNAARKDSQGLCFLGPVSLDEMLARELPLSKGAVLSENGEIVGEHDSAALYTLGQRHGFTIKSKNAQTPAYFVIDKDVEKNTITVSTSPFPTGVTQTVLKLTDTNWIGEIKDGSHEARFRYRQKLIPAQVHFSQSTAEVRLEQPFYAPIGQSLVLYSGERCVGGGIITTSTLR